MFRARRIVRRRAIAGSSVAGGAAYHPAKRADTGRQEQAPEAHDEAPPPDPVEQIKELAELHEQGILTEEEFAAEKKKLLGS